MTDNDQQTVDSLLPYDDWTETAMRQVVARALSHVAANGLPGEHHFYLTFRTDHLGVVLPPRLRAQYPQEMTIVLQHQFWDLKMDEEAGLISVGLSFGGVPATLVVPLGAVIAFADPHVRYGMRFRAAQADVEFAEAQPPMPIGASGASPAAAPGSAEVAPEGTPQTPQVVSLDAFRRRPPSKG